MARAKTSNRRGALAAAGQSSGGATSVSFLSTYAPLTANNSFNTGLTVTSAMDLSAYSATADKALVIALNWYANGGGALTYTCTYGGSALTLMTGEDRTGGTNYGAMVWIIQNPSLTGTLSCQAQGTSNTGRNLWVSASLFGGVGSWEAGSWAEPASGVAHNITLAAGEYAVNAMCGGANLNAYSQTQRQYSTVASTLRGLSGDATGAGVKAFSTTGGAYNSALAKLKPAA